MSWCWEFYFCWPVQPSRRCRSWRWAFLSRFCRPSYFCFYRLFILRGQWKKRTRTHLKKVFWPPAFFGGIGAAFKILDIQQYASGFKLGPVARVPAKPLGEDVILNQNPIFEMLLFSFSFFPADARVAELVDALDLGSSSGNRVGVQVSPLAPILKFMKCLAVT